MSEIILLFLIFLKIGAFSFGGGYAMLPFIQQEFISKYHFITNQEFLDLLAISQSTPGPVAINSATFVGFKACWLLWFSSCNCWCYNFCINRSNYYIKVIF